MHLTIILHSCIARTGEHLNIIGERWSQDLTEALERAMDLGMLWDQYGIVGDVTVSTFLISYSQAIDNTLHPTLSFSLLEYISPSSSRCRAHSRTLASQPASTSLPILQAIHVGLPSRRYLRGHRTRYPSPSHQGYFQGPLGDLGRGVPHFGSWQDPRSGYIR